MFFSYFHHLCFSAFAGSWWLVCYLFHHHARWFILLCTKLNFAKLLLTNLNDALFFRLHIIVAGIILPGTHEKIQTEQPLQIPSQFTFASWNWKAVNTAGSTAPGDQLCQATQKDPQDMVILTSVPCPILQNWLPKNSKILLFLAQSSTGTACLRRLPWPRLRLWHPSSSSPTCLHLNHKPRLCAPAPAPYPPTPTPRAYPLSLSLSLSLIYSMCVPVCHRLENVYMYIYV